MNKKLDSLKKIPLDQFCINELGYIPFAPKDSKLWRCLIGPHGYKIITKSVPNKNGDYLFMCPEKDVRGSILNLLVLLHGYDTLGILVTFCGSKRSFYEPVIYSKLDHKNTTEVVKKEYDVYLKKCTNGPYNYLIRRGISAEVINYFKIYVADRELFLPLYVLKNGAWEVATAIRYIFNQNNDRQRYFLKGLKKQGAYTLFTPQKMCVKYYNTLMIFESPVDALSYAQLFPSEREAIFMSFCGGFGEVFKEQLLLFLKKVKISKIAICVDDDKTGNSVRTSLKNFLKEFNICFKIPQKKDWNDQLIYSINNK